LSILEKFHSRVELRKEQDEILKKNKLNIEQMRHCMACQTHIEYNIPSDNAHKESISLSHHRVQVTYDKNRSTRWGEKMACAILEYIESQIILLNNTKSEKQIIVFLRYL
jgi:hypothetical protein